MPNNRRLLITGHEGYIGSVMAPWLRSQDYDVVGLDTGYFHDCTLVPAPSGIRSIRKDLREVSARDLDGFDAVIHLAALSNDPIGNMNEGWTREINGEGTIRLAQLAKEAGASVPLLLLVHHVRHVASLGRRRGCAARAADPIRPLQGRCRERAARARR